MWNRHLSMLRRGAAPAIASATRRSPALPASIGPQARPFPDRAGGWIATWIAGPAAGATTTLAPGTWSVGRHPLATVRCADPDLAPFEAHLEVAGDGRLELTLLVGRPPAHRSDRWTEDGARLIASAGGRPVWVDLGASRLELRPTTGADAPDVPVAEPDGNLGRSVVRRAPPPALVWRPAPVEVPAASSNRGPGLGGLGGLVPAVLTIVASVVTAMVLDQPMFLVLGVVGGAVAILGWGVQSWSGWRRARAGATALRDAVDEFGAALDRQRRQHAAHHALAVGTLADASRDVLQLRRGLWAHRAGSPHAHTVAIGLGDATWEPVLAPHASLPATCWPVLERASVHRDAALPVTITTDARIAVCGPHAAAMARSLVIQLAARCGPADWQLLVVSDEPRGWAWAMHLPHLVSGGVVGADDLLTLCRDPGRLAGRHTVVVTDDWRALTVRTSALRRFLALDLGSAAIAVCPTPADVPSVCTAMLDAGPGARGRWIPDLTASTLPIPVRLMGLHAEDADVLARALGHLIDPEDGRSSVGDLPRSCSLAALLAADGRVPTAAAIAARWQAAEPGDAPAGPIGVAIDGTVEIDLVRDGPHALLAGTTGAGKSELLRTLVLSLATRLSPEQLCFVLVDYKGGAAFDVCLPLPHVVGSVTDLDDRLAERALRSLRAELRRREEILRAHGAPDLASLRRQDGAPVVPRLLVVIDEFAALAVEHPAFLGALVGVAQRGRSLGVHLLLATQRPHGVISDDIRANTNLRMALRLHDTADSLDVIGDASAARLPRDAPGRAIMRLGPTELVEFQTAHTGGGARGGRTEAEEIVAAIVGAAALMDIPAPHRPWREPLGTDIDASTLPPGTLGVADLPDEQAQRAVSWRPADGGVAVIGARGAGVTTTLRSLAHLAILHGSGVYVIDAGGDSAWDHLRDDPRCGGVVRLGERERLTRLLRRFGERDGERLPEVADELAAPSLVVIDGLATLRAELDTAERTREHDALVRLVGGTSGRGGAVVAIGAEDAASLPSWALARCGHRWLMRVHDHHHHDAVALGLPAGSAPPDVAGRAIAVGFADAEAVEVQFVRMPAPPVAHGVTPAPPVGVLPTSCASSALPRPRRTTDEWRCPVGVGFDALAPHRITVPDGEHVVVLGPPRSGRSSALVRLVLAWLDTPGDEPWVGVLAPRRSPLRDLGSSGVHLALDVRDLLDGMPHDGRPGLVVVDDAELVDDVDGRLAALATSRRPGVVVALAGRGESLRAAYGHWSAAVRRSRRGILMAGCHETDGDLLGVVLPRRMPLPPRPGLAHVVEDGDVCLVQLALDAVPIPAPELARPRAADREDGICAARRRVRSPAVS